MEAYENGNYAAAQRMLLVEAHAGNARAQEMLGFMYAFGPELYRGVPRDLKTSWQWFDRAARSGQPVSRYMYCALARRDDQLRPVAAYCFDRASFGQWMR